MPEPRELATVATDEVRAPIDLASAPAPSEAAAPSPAPPAARPLVPDAPRPRPQLGRTLPIPEPTLAAGSTAPAAPVVAPPRLAGLRRLSRRWVAPAATITLAVAGLAVLGSLPTEADPRLGPHEKLAIKRPRPGVAVGRVVPGVPAPRPERLAEQVLAPRLLRAPTPAPVVAEKPEPPLGAPPDALLEIECATDMMARLRAVDRVIYTQPADDAAALIEHLLDRPPPASGDEARTFRVALLGRLGCLPSCERADQRLLQSLDPAQPRAERLLAIEALARGGVHPTGRGTLQHLAASENDLEVRKKAQWALQQVD